MAEFTIRAGNQLCDVSLVSSSSENPEIASIKSFGISFFNNMVMTCFKLISLTNLILLGHILYNEKVDYQLFMTFQIGVFILEVLGKYFIIGLLNRKLMKIIMNHVVLNKFGMNVVIKLIG